MSRLSLHLLAVSAFVLVPSCSSTFTSKACKTDDDCGAGIVCVEGEAQAVCKNAADAPIRIGMSAPISGPSQDLGTEMRKGVLLAFNEQNALGGVRGRKLELEFRDDEYRPDEAEAAARDLLDVAEGTAPARCPTTTQSITAGSTPVASGSLIRGSNAVMGLLGSVGTPTMVRSAPIAVETQSLFFGAFTGASKVLRDGAAGACSKYIFNIRASYYQEARATVEYFLKLHVPDARHLVSFDQNDSFGQAGYDGLIAAYTGIKGSIDQPISADTPIKRLRYTRDDESSVPAQIAAASAYLGSLLATDATSPHVVGIFMTDTYGPATGFIQGIRDWQYANDAEQAQNHKATRLSIYFSNVSFVGPNTLAQRLHDAGNVQTPQGSKPYSDGVFVSQVVPNYQTDNSDAVHAYKHALDIAGLDPSFTSLEGYLAGRVFVAGLVQHQGPISPDALISTFEHLQPLNLGLGASSGFAPDNHNYSKSVFGTAIGADGSFTDRYFWSDGTTISLFE